MTRDTDDCNNFTHQLINPKYKILWINIYISSTVGVYYSNENLVIFSSPYHPPAGRAPPTGPEAGWQAPAAEDVPTHGGHHAHS